MKKTLLIILNALLIIPFIVFFKRGAIVAIFMLPVWFIMTIINTVFSKNIKEIVLYNGTLATLATIGIFVCGQLYFKYVYWDSIGETIVILEMVIEVFYIAILTVIEYLIKYLIKKHKKN